MRVHYLVYGALALASCNGGRAGRTPCGIAALAGPTLLLNEFTTPQQTLSVPPVRLPERVVARIAAGPAYPALVGRVDSAWVIGVEGTIAEADMPGFGVLALDQSAKSRGVMLYPGEPISGAPVIGHVSIGSHLLPLIGIQVNPRRYEDPACPFFPDSILQ